MAMAAMKSTKSASSNPFASTTLPPPAKTSTMSKTGDAPKANPFASVALASSSGSSAAKSTFSFGASAPAPTPAPAAAAPKPSIGFAFGSTNTSQSTSAAASKSVTISTPKSSSSSKGETREKIQELNENLLRMIVDHWEGRHYTQNYSFFMKQYMEHAARLQAELDEEEGSGDREVTDISASRGLGSWGGNNNSQPAATSFSFGGSPAAAPAPSPAAAAKPSFSFGASAPAPSAAANSFSFGATPAPAPGAGTKFSFSAKPSSPVAPAAPSFSFGATSAPASSATSTASNNNNADPTSNPDDGKIEKVEQEENTDEEILHEVRAKHMKLENGKWKKYGTGVLRLYCHKTTSKQRMVIRNEIGKVQFNVAVSKGMTFEKKIVSSKKGKAAFVSFLACEDPDKGLESFMIQTKPESLDKLHSALEGMVA